MPNRSYTAGSQFRYGFNGKENDNDVKGTGNQNDYGSRVYDTRIGRFLSVDPLQAKFTDLTPYHYTTNNPINLIDYNGKDTIRFQKASVVFPQKEIQDGIYLPTRGPQSTFSTVVIQAPGPDVFFFDIVETVIEALGPVTKIRTKEFFPNTPWKKTGITESPGFFGLWNVSDPDFVSLAKLASPELTQYLNKHDHVKYGGLNFIKEQYQEYENATAIANTLLLVRGVVKGAFSLLNSGGIQASFSVLSSAGGVSREMSIVRIIKKGEKIDDIMNEGKALTWTTGNEHALVTLKNGDRALVSGGPGGIIFKKGQLRTLFGHTHPTSAPPSQSDVDALKALNQQRQYVLHGGVISEVKRK